MIGLAAILVLVGIAYGGFLYTVNSDSDLDASERAQLCTPVRSLLEWYGDNPALASDGLASREAIARNAEAADQLATTYGAMTDYFPSEELRREAQGLAEASRRYADNQHELVADMEARGETGTYVGNYSEQLAYPEIRELIESTCSVSLPSTFQPEVPYIG